MAIEFLNDQILIDPIFLMWVCRNVIGTTHQIDGWNSSHKNGDERGMVYEIAIPTL